MTEPETRLWYHLKDRNGGIIFKRQKPFGPYILDFYCFAAKLVVEVDGNTHDEDAIVVRDTARDAYLTRAGLYVYRVSAGDVYRDAYEVAVRVWLFAKGRISGET